MAEKQSLAQLTKRKKANKETVPVCLDPELGKKHWELKETIALTEAEKVAFAENDERLKDVEERLLSLNKELKTLEPKLKKEMYDFVLESVNPATQDKLLTDNPATQKQLADAKKEGLEISWNPETFPAALVAACLTDPESTIEEVLEMWTDDHWNSAELNDLFNAAMRVSNTKPSVNIKKD